MTCRYCDDESYTKWKGGGGKEKDAELLKLYEEKKKKYIKNLEKLTSIQHKYKLGGDRVWFERNQRHWESKLEEIEEKIRKFHLELVTKKSKGLLQRTWAKRKAKRKAEREAERKAKREAERKAEREAEKKKKWIRRLLKEAEKYDTHQLDYYGFFSETPRKILWDKTQEYTSPRRRWWDEIKECKGPCMIQPEQTIWGGEQTKECSCYIGHSMWGDYNNWKRCPSPLCQYSDKRGWQSEITKDDVDKESYLDLRNVPLSKIRRSQLSHLLYSDRDIK